MPEQEDGAWQRGHPGGPAHVPPTGAAPERAPGPPSEAHSQAEPVRCPIPGQLALFRAYVVGWAGATEAESVNQTPVEVWLARHSIVPCPTQAGTPEVPAPFSPDPRGAHLPARHFPRGDPGGRHTGDSVSHSYTACDTQTPSPAKCPPHTC